MRFPPIEPDALTLRQRQVAEAIAARRVGGLDGIYVPLLHSPEVADLAQMLGEYLRFNLRVPERLRVLAVLVAISRYDDTVIQPLLEMIRSSETGFSDEDVQLLAKGRRPAGMAAAEGLVFDFCTQLGQSGRVTNVTFDALAGRLGREVCLELVVLYGHAVFATLLHNVTELAPPADRENIL